MTAFIVYLITLFGLQGQEAKMENFRNSEDYAKYEQEYLETEKSIITYDDLEDY